MITRSPTARASLLAVLIAAWWPADAAGAAAAPAQPQPPRQTADAAAPAAAQDGFVPVESRPPQDIDPGAAPGGDRLRASSGSCCVGYLWSIWRRLGTVRA